MKGGGRSGECGECGDLGLRQKRTATLITSASKINKKKIIINQAVVSAISRRVSTCSQHRLFTSKPPQQTPALARSFPSIFPLRTPTSRAWRPGRREWGGVAAVGVFWSLHRGKMMVVTLQRSEPRQSYQYSCLAMRPGTRAAPGRSPAAPPAPSRVCRGPNNSPTDIPSFCFTFVAFNQPQQFKSAYFT